MLPQKKIGCGQGVVHSTVTKKILGFGTQGAPISQGKRGKKDVGLKVLEFPRNTLGTHKWFGTHRAQISQEKKNGMWDSKRTNFPGTQKLGLNVHNFLEKNWDLRRQASKFREINSYLVLGASGLQP